MTIVKVSWSKKCWNVYNVDWTNVQLLESVFYSLLKKFMIQIYSVTYCAVFFPMKPILSGSRSLYKDFNYLLCLREKLLKDCLHAIMINKPLFKIFAMPITEIVEETAAHDSLSAQDV